MSEETYGSGTMTLTDNPTTGEGAEWESDNADLYGGDWS
jgi:hypothetical protein